MKRLSHLFLILALLTLTACQQKTATPAATSASPPVAVVNGKPISTETFDFYVKTRANRATSDLTPEQKQQLLDELVRIELAAQQATKDGLDKQPDVANRLALTHDNVLAEAAFQNFLKGKTPTEQELRAEYETQVAALGKTEYRARHILVATESYAQSIIDKLQKGGDFASIAEKESMDNS